MNAFISPATEREAHSLTELECTCVFESAWCALARLIRRVVTLLLKPLTPVLSPRLVARWGDGEKAAFLRRLRAQSCPLPGFHEEGPMTGVKGRRPHTPGLGFEKISCSSWSSSDFAVPIVFGSGVMRDAGEGLLQLTEKAVAL
jgi:hypothetical protein